MRFRKQSSPVSPLLTFFATECSERFPNERNFLVRLLAMLEPTWHKRLRVSQTGSPALPRLKMSAEWSSSSSQPPAS